MSIFVQNEIIMYIVFALCVFFVSYKWAPKILDRFYKRTMNSQKEVLQIFELMRIQKDPKKIIASLWGFCLCMGLLPIVLFLNMILVGVVLGIVFFIFSWEAVKAVMKKSWEAYCSKVEDQLGEGMTLMANGLKVGLSVTQSMEKVVQRLKGPLGSEFTLVLNKIKLGVSLEEALESMAQRVKRQDMTMFVTSVNILKETGGNLAETFTVLAETIRERQKLHSKIKALTSQAMFQAQVISFMPVVIIGIMYMFNRSSALLLFTTVLGWVCLGIIAFLVFFGGKLMRKMATIEV